MEDRTIWNFRNDADQLEGQVTALSLVNQELITLFLQLSHEDKIIVFQMCVDALEMHREGYTDADVAVYLRRTYEGV